LDVGNKGQYASGEYTGDIMLEMIRTIERLPRFVLVALIVATAGASTIVRIVN
jgi:hypothetical protein